LPDLGGHFALLVDEFEAAKAAPLSTRKAMLTAMLADAYADRLFAAQSAEGDILVFRSGLAERSPALKLVFDLCAIRPDGVRLVTEAVSVPIAGYGTLGVEDFMVSLYSDHTVQRVRIALPDGSRREVHEVLAAATAELDRLRNQPEAARSFGGS
jgi:hypothetical protein